MTSRTFVVFQDDPSVPLPTVKADASPTLPSPPVEPTILVPSNTPVTSAEKENLHPLTGARSSAVTDSQTKKRKNGILATKLHIPPTTKKPRDLALDCRKRKTTTLSSSKSSNGGRAADSGAPDLSKVDEVVETAETDQPCRYKATQAEVDSKCYDLTVSPLADVSHAFDQVSISPTESQPKVSRILTPKKASPHEHSGISSVKPVGSVGSPKLADIGSEEAFFSTPERKQIYAAFTFASPSPSSSSAKHFTASHLDIFGDIRFDP